VQSMVLTSAKTGTHSARPCLHKCGAAFLARTLKMVLRNMGKASSKMLVAKLLTSFSLCEVISRSSLVFVGLLVNISISYAQLVSLYYLGNSTCGI